MKQDFFSGMSDCELRTKTDEIYQDVLDAANLCPETPWHEACFAALYLACQELQSRKMPPPKYEGLMQ